MVEHSYEGGEQDRSILIGMITNRSVLGRISTAWRKDGLFASKFCNVIAACCIEFYQNHKQAPERNIVPAIREWFTEHKADKDTVKATELLLGHLSNEYEQLAEGVNPDYLMELAQKRFERVHKEKLANAIKQAVDAGKHEKVDEILANFGRVELGSAEGSYLSEKEGWMAAFEEKKEPLIQYNGAAGRFMGDAFERDGFISFVAPEKRGKSHHLIYLSYLAAKQRKKVAFFGAGDMSIQQYRRRFASLAARRPQRPGSYRIPTGIEIYTEGNGYRRAKPNGFKEKNCENWLTWQEGYNAYLEMLQEAKLAKDPLWISCHANSTLSVPKMRAILDQREQVDGFIPDIIVIDYADILALSSKMEPRDAHDHNWRQLRALSLERHCLVVTATQSNRKGYDVDLLRMDNMSEDKRKLAHATGILGINVTAPEKEAGVCRLNWIALRENEFSSRRVVFCAGCLGFSNPCIKTAMASDVDESGQVEETEQVTVGEDTPTRNGRQQSNRRRGSS